MKCSNCQSNNREGAQFCSRCGKELGFTCRYCQGSCPPGALFCDHCGQSLTGEQQSEVIPLHKTPSSSSLDGERKLLTILFADVVGYTTIAEKLDPEEVHHIMDGLFKLLMEHIISYGGTIAQFMGDGVMALFGAPIAHEDHAQRACHAALSIQKGVMNYGGILEREYGVEFRIRVGINSGLVVAGVIGDDLHMDYTALGDTANLASRLQCLAAPGSILVSQKTHKLAKDYFDFQPRGTAKVKGMEKVVETYDLVRAREQETRMRVAVARGLSKFVGREQEIATLKRVFEKVESGSGQIVGLVGEAGVGKSRLLFEFRNLLRNRDITYLEGECLHYGSSMAYRPILDILRSYFTIKEGQQEALVKQAIDDRLKDLPGDLTYVLPPLHELFSLSVKDDLYATLDPQQKRQRILEAIRDILLRESQRKTLVVAVENLLWIDNTSEGFLNYLIGWLANARALLILLYRPEYLPGWKQKSYYNGIALNRLAPAAGPKLIRSLLKGGDVAPEVLDLIMARAGGNPLFIEELTNTLVENGHIRKAGGSFVLSKGLSEIHVPDTVQGIIAARIDRLPENLKRLLQVASVLGKEFAFPILDRITDSIQDTKSRLFELQELEFIYEKRLFPELVYVFKHDLVQEVAYSGLLFRHRRRIHEAAGVAIETLYAERIGEFYELLAYHYSKSDNTEKAYLYLKLSGTKAVQNSSQWEAFRFYKDAIDLLDKTEQTDAVRAEQMEIRLLAASPMLSLSFPEDSLRILQDGEKLARQMRAAKYITSFCSVIGLCYSIKGDLPAGMKYGETCFRIAEKTGDVELIAPIAFDLGSNYMARGDFLKLTSVTPRVLSLIEKEGKEYDCFDRGYNIYSALLGFHGFGAGYTGDFEKACLLCSKGRDVAARIENLYSLGLIEVLHGYILCHQAQGKESLQHFRNAIEYLEKGQIFVLLGLAWSGLGYGHLYLGELDAARNYIEKGLKLHAEAGARYNLSVHYWFLSMVHYELQEFSKARHYAEEAVRLAHTCGERYYEATSRMTLGRIEATAGDRGSLKRGEKTLQQAIRVLTRLGVKNMAGAGYMCLAETCALTGFGEGVTEALEKAHELFLQTDATNWLIKLELLTKRVAGTI